MLTWLVALRAVNWATGRAVALHTGKPDAARYG